MSAVRLVIDRKDSETVGQSKTFFVNVDTGFKYLLSWYSFMLIFKLTTLSQLTKVYLNTFIRLGNWDLIAHFVIFS